MPPASWDLSALYGSAAAFAADMALVKEQSQRLRAVEGPITSAASLADLLGLASDTQTRAVRMEIYSILAAETDTTSPEAQRRYDVATALSAEAIGALAPLSAATRELGSATVADWLAHEPRLQRHRLRLRRILDAAPHALDAKQAARLSRMARWPQLAGDVYDSLMDSDLGWLAIDNAQGQQISVDRAAYQEMRQSADATLRRRASDAFLGRLSELQRVFGLLYTRRVEADLSLAKERGFSSGIDAAWEDKDGVPAGTYRQVVAAARSALPELRRYFALRRRAAAGGFETLADLYAPQAGPDTAMPIEQVKRLAVEISAPFGTAYQERLRRRMEQPWFDLTPRPNKRGTYGIFPSIGGAPPYFMMSYRGTYRDARAFVGGLTLQMAFADVPASTPMDTWDPAIYSNAVIYVGDLLFDDARRLSARSPEERAAAALRAADLLWTYFFQWALVTELDARVEMRVGTDDPPSGAEVSEMFLELLRDYVGADDAAPLIPESLGALWATYPVEFFSYDHQFWPPAMAAAILIVERLRAGDR